MNSKVPQEAQGQISGRLPTCPLCGNGEFQQEEGRLDSRWGMTSHRLTLLICTRCRYILQFYDKHSIWGFD